MSNIPRCYECNSVMDYEHKHKNICDICVQLIAQEQMEYD